MENKLALKNVRLSFPVLFTPAQFKGTGDAKFSCSFLLHKEKNAGLIKKVEAAMQQLAEETWGKGKLPKKLEYFLTDGNDKDYDGAEGYMVVSSSNKTRPVTIDRRRTPLAEADNVLYAGCFVNASISIWAQDNTWGKRINANLRGVQFFAEGEAFSGSVVDVDDEFEDCGEDVADIDEDIL